MAGQSKPAAAAAVTYLATTPLDMPKAWAQRRWEWPIDQTCCKIDLILCVISNGGGMDLQKSPSNSLRVEDNPLLSNPPSDRGAQRWDTMGTMPGILSRVSEDRRE